MSKHALKLVAVFLFTITATGASASDDGQTHPKLNNMSVGNGTSSPQDIVGLTNGAGNVKGYQCQSISFSQLSAASVKIFVDGGSAQTLNISNAEIVQDGNATTPNYYTMMIPLNVRFGTSIKVQIAGNQSGAAVDCSVSWALD